MTAKVMGATLDVASSPRVTADSPLLVLLRDIVTKFSGRRVYIKVEDIGPNDNTKHDTEIHQD